MRKEELHSALMHPENLTDEQLRELSETVSRFPFFGAAQIALTRAFKARGDIRFTDQLSQAAIYTGHRASLYQRLKATKPSRVPEVELPAQANPPAEEMTLASIILETEGAVTSESAVSELIVKPAQSELIKPAEAVPHFTATPPAVEKDSEVAVTKPVKLSELDPLEAQFLVNAVNTSIELEVQPEHIGEPGGPMTTDMDDEPIDENSYAALIYRRAQRKNQLAAEETPSDGSVLDETEDLPAFRSTPLSHGVQRIRSTDAKQHQRDLIDRFIHTEPQIARGKAGEYPTGNLAKESLEDDFSLVTETMAVLFAKQGKLDKARKAFRKLMEQHPEKSIYFAAQLKNLEHFKK